ncbi:MAG: hypothetical protein IJD52_01045 [Alphaproteobacteria bacterium]|nr:hypothetical protein [Alphaproteobacteria bacterium]
METNTQPKLIKVHSLIEERIFIDKKYPEFVLLSQSTTSITQNGKEITCDVLIGQTNEGVKEFWFDISSFYGQANSMSTSNYIFGNQQRNTNKNYIGPAIFLGIIVVIVIAALINS